MAVPVSMVLVSKRMDNVDSARCVVIPDHKPYAELEEESTFRL